MVELLGKAICWLFKKFKVCLPCNPDVPSLGTSFRTTRRHPKKVCTHGCLQQYCVEQFKCGVVSNVQQMLRQPKCGLSIQRAVIQPIHTVSCHSVYPYSELPSSLRRDRGHAEMCKNIAGPRDHSPRRANTENTESTHEGPDGIKLQTGVRMVGAGYTGTGC